jgi:hypothetical protein
VLQPGAATTRFVSGAHFGVTAPGTTAGNGFEMALLTGNTPTVDQINVSQPKSATTLAEVNLGLIPFFRYDVVFDVVRGNVGFAPCTAAPAAGPAAPIPTLSAWSIVLLAAVPAMSGVLAVVVSALRRSRT